MGKQLLITGFDPFGGEAVNPAWKPPLKPLTFDPGCFTMTLYEPGSEDDARC